MSDEDSHEKQLLKPTMPPIHVPQHAGETDFPYELLSQIHLPEEIRMNFIQLAWKTRCNMSDNVYDQLIDIRDSNFLKLKAYRKALFQWSGICSQDIDCCRNGMLPSNSQIMKSC